MAYENIIYEVKDGKMENLFHVKWMNIMKS